MNVKSVARSLSGKLSRKSIILLVIELLKHIDVPRAQQLNVILQSMLVNVASSRPSCPRCVLKHLGQACVLYQESGQGYPSHLWLAIGHMAEAEAECQNIDSKFANVLRRERKKSEDGYIPNCELLIQVFLKRRSKNVS